jgi:NAD+ synthase
MVKDIGKLADYLVAELKKFGRGCKKHFVAVSGGIDSATVAALLCKAFGSENIFGMYRDIESNPKHWKDAQLLQKKFGFELKNFNANPLYKEILRQTHFWLNGQAGFSGACDSLKSCLTTPLADFIAKAIDNGGGRIYGTGNWEEDGLLYYFNKRGDGAVDYNVLGGLTKAEVRQLARHLGVPEKLITKKPSADLQGNGDKHNDESELTALAKRLGYNIKISYGAPDGSSEGLVAWAGKEELKRKVISKPRFIKIRSTELGYSEAQIQTILFLREMKKRNAHKDIGIPRVKREVLFRRGLVD